MDKLTIGLLADILYIKGIICYEELEALQEMKHPTDVQNVVDKMLNGEYNVLKRGESYLDYTRK